MACRCKKRRRALAVAKGAVKRVKAWLGVGLASDRVKRHRRAICRDCEHATPCKKQTGKKCYCAQCGCPLIEKTALAAESCPLPEPKWGAV